MTKLTIAALSLVLIAGAANAAEPTRSLGVKFGIANDESVTVAMGYAPAKVLALETAFERNNGTNTVWVNVTPTVQVARLGVYGLAGAGYDFTGRDVVFNAGVGAKVNIAPRIEADMRLRRSFTELTDLAENRFSVGLNFKF